MATYSTAAAVHDHRVEQELPSHYNAEAEARRLRVLRAFAQLDATDAERIVTEMEAAAFRARHEDGPFDHPAAA